jgi:hypothetical protein
MVPGRVRHVGAGVARRGTVASVFEPGTQIRVRRSLGDLGLYWHHGIYVGDSEVVEFGGGKLLNKGGTQIRQVSLECFEHGVAAEAVSHPITWMGLEYMPQLSPEDVLDRAEWLCYDQPPEYQLGCRNCESIAVWCATGAFESFQVKAFTGALAWLLLASTFLHRRWPALWKWLSIAISIASLLTAVPYVMDRAFFDHTRRYPGRGNWPTPQGS